MSRATVCTIPIILTDKIKNQFTIFSSIAIEVLNFMVISYVLISAIISLKSSIISILFSASLLWLFDRFYSTLKKLTKNKWIALSIYIVTIALKCVIVYYVGYLKGTITKW